MQDQHQYDISPVHDRSIVCDLICRDDGGSAGYRTSAGREPDADYGRSALYQRGAWIFRRRAVSDAALIRENTIKEYEIPLWEVREEIPVPPFCMLLSSALFCSSRAPFAKLYPCKYIGKRGCFFPIRIV